MRAIKRLYYTNITYEYEPDYDRGKIPGTDVYYSKFSRKNS